MGLRGAAHAHGLMKTDRASRTAHLVALGRAVADAGITHVTNFHDPTARVLLDDKGKRRLATLERAAHGGRRNRLPRIRLEIARGMADMMALRTAAIDAAVREALANGTKQVVILGAGFDGRAWRMPELS